MAPQMGPNEAPMTWKTLLTSPAQPLTAKAAAANAPTPTEIAGLTFGIVVLKLFAAISDEKQAPGRTKRPKRSS